MDYPGGYIYKETLFSMCHEFYGPARAAFGGSGSSAATVWPSANLGIFLPFKLKGEFLVTKLYWLNGGTAAGNVDIGIYQAQPQAGTAALVVSTGATAQSGVSALQKVTLGTAKLLSPGAYYLGLSASLGTATFQDLVLDVSTMRMVGCGQMAAAHPLPNTVTFAAITAAYWPMMGLSNAGTL